MISYTIAAYTMFISILKKVCKGFQIALSLFTLVYLTFAVITQIGIFPINVTLLVLYFLYTAYLTFFKKKNTNDTTKTVKRVYRITKLVLKAIPLATTLYTLWITTHNTNGLTIIITTLLLILWILQVLMEILIFILESNIKLFTSAALIDFKWVVDLHNHVSNNEKDWYFDYEQLHKNVECLEPIIDAQKAAKDAKIAEKKEKIRNTIKAFIPPILHVNHKKVKTTKVKKVKVKKSPKNSD